jgi:hypothetical protein
MGRILVFFYSFKKRPKEAILQAKTDYISVPENE